MALALLKDVSNARHSRSKYSYVLRVRGWVAGYCVVQVISGRSHVNNKDKLTFADAPRRRWDAGWSCGAERRETEYEIEFITIFH